MFSKVFHKIKYPNIARYSGSLAVAFNSNEYSKLNKKYENEKITGLFGISDLRSPSGLIAMRYKAENDCNLLISEALSQGRDRKIVEILDDMSDSICRVADLSECMRLLHPDENARKIAMATSQTMSLLVENLNTNRDLFSVLDNVCSSNVDVKCLDDVDKRVGQLLHSDFVASGINLDRSIREKFVVETQKCIEFGSLFHEGTESAVQLKGSILPKKLQERLGLKPDQKVEISHAYLLADDPHLREMGYRIFHYNNSEQEELLRKLMESRFNVANYAGFTSFAERANIHMICETPNKVLDFLNNLSIRLLPYAEKDRLKILQLKYQKKLTTQDLYSGNYLLMPWDYYYFCNSVKQSALPASYDVYSPYLSLGNCMEGINLLFKSLFGVELEVEETIPGELWHPDVFKIVVRHKMLGYIGTVYCDMFARPGKSITDCHYTIQAGKQLSDGTYQNPIVVLQGNLTPVSPDDSLTFLTPPLVETLFHEWGHAIHSLLARTRYQHVAGTRCSTDLAEAPSTLMEHFALDARVLKEFARHYKTSEKLSDTLLNPVSKQRYICSAIEHQMTIVNSMFDQIIHGKDLILSTRDTSVVYQSIFTDESMVIGSKIFDLPSDNFKTYWPQRFAHLINYGAKYYSYLMSNCISGFLWKNGFHSDPWSSSFGDKYKRKILEHGGERKPLEMISDFSDSNSITIDSLLDGFIEDLEINYNNY